MKSLLVVLLAGSLLLGGCGVKKSEGDTVVMKVGDTAVTAGDLSIVIDEAISYYGEENFDGAKTAALEQLKLCLKSEAVAKGLKLEATEDEQEQIMLAKANKASAAGGLKAYKERLNEIGSSISFVEEYSAGSVMYPKVKEVIDAEVKGEEVKDADLKKFYNDKYYKAKHILIPFEATEETEKAGEEFAKEVLKRAKDGEDFDALMKEYSKDPGSESNPDGYVFTEGEMVTEFYDCTAGLDENAIGMCESTYGYHIIKRLPLENSWFDENKETVSSAYQNKLFEERFDEMCKEYKIEITVDEKELEKFTQDIYTSISIGSSNMMNYGY